MADRPSTGELFGVPYNFDRPSINRMLQSYWRPDEGMLTEKPFGVGYTLNLANWRSWIVLTVAGALLWHEQKGTSRAEAEGGPVEVIVDDD